MNEREWQIGPVRPEFQEKLLSAPNHFPVFYYSSDKYGAGVSFVYRWGAISIMSKFYML